MPTTKDNEFEEPYTGGPAWLDTERGAVVGPVEAARTIAAAEDAKWPQGARVRVVRAVVYEGPAERVRQQLASSLPVGSRDTGLVTITVSQGPVEVL
jgi:hypothetical protein